MVAEIFSLSGKTAVNILFESFSSFRSSLGKKS